MRLPRIQIKAYEMRALHSGLTWVFGYQKSSLNIVLGLVCKMEPQNQTFLEVSCPWTASGLPHRYHISFPPLEKLEECWERSLEGCCFEKTGTHSTSCADWVRGCRRRAWGRAWGKSEVCHRWCTPKGCLPLLPLSLPQTSCRFAVIPQGLVCFFPSAGTSPVCGCPCCLSSYRILGFLSHTLSDLLKDLMHTGPPPPFPSCRSLS